MASTYVAQIATSIIKLRVPDHDGQDSGGVGRGRQYSDDMTDGVPI
jgi:hypothetical protein